MDAKTLLDAFVSEGPEGCEWNRECYDIFVSALSLAAAVEGPEEACPDVEAWFYGVITRNGRALNLLAADARQFARKLANERNAALRTLKAERERAGKMGAVLDRVIAWNEKYPSWKIFNHSSIVKVASEMDEINRAALAAHEGSHD